MWWIFVVACVICIAFAQEFANSGSSWEFVYTTTVLFMVFLCCCCFGGRCCWQFGPGKCVLQLAVIFQLGYNIYAYIETVSFEHWNRTFRHDEDFLKENHMNIPRDFVVMCGQDTFEVLGIPLSNMMVNVQLRLHHH